MRSIRILAPAILLLVGLLAAPSAAGEAGVAEEGTARAVPTHCGGKPVTIYGTTSKEVIKGTPGDDIIHGLGGSDRIKGLGGNDTICGGYGDDIIWGGPGIDFIYGGKGDDSLNGGGKADLLSGAAGNDVFDPGPGIGGTIEGGTGHDYIWILDAGDNDIFGGGGKDTVSFSSAPVRMRVDLSTGHYDSWAVGPLIGSLIFEVEVVIGTVYNDILIGDLNRNWLYGYLGNDVIKGRGGDDFLYGEPGADTLIGGAGWDVVDGGSNIDDCTGEVQKHCP